MQSCQFQRYERCMTNTIGDTVTSAKQVSPATIRFALVLLGVLTTLTQPTVLSRIGGHRADNSPRVRAGTFAYAVISVAVITAITATYSRCCHGRAISMAYVVIMALVVATAIGAAVWYYTIVDELRRSKMIGESADARFPSRSLLCGDHFLPGALPTSGADSLCGGGHVVAVTPRKHA